MRDMERQRTIGHETIVEGIGLQTGKRVRMRLLPAPTGAGVTFTRVDLSDRPSLNLRLIDDQAPGAVRRTTLGNGPLQVQTTEHLLAAFAGLGIDNITIELDNEELPGLDGSAARFADAIRAAGVVEQDRGRKTLALAAPVWCEGKGGSALVALPADHFAVSYTLSYEDPCIGTQFFAIAVTEEAFLREIAPARTFCLEAEAAALIAMGLGKGANYDNTLVMGAGGPVKNTLRFPDEPVRHKVLDLIGDLYLVGMPVRAHIIAIKSGHNLNMELVKKLKKLIDAVDRTGANKGE